MQQQTQQPLSQQQSQQQQQLAPQTFQQQQQQQDAPSTPSDVLDLPRGTTPPPNQQISFTVAGGAAELGGVAGQQLGLVTGVGIPASVLQTGDVTSDPLGLGLSKSSLDFGDSDSEMTDGQSIQTPGKPKRIRVSSIDVNGRGRGGRGGVGGWLTPSPRHLLRWHGI